MYEDINKLVVFQKAHVLVLEIYKITRHFPREEQYGLMSQMKRAAVSIPSNIAEGRARGSTKEYKRFLLIARGSLEELKYQIYLSKDLKFINQAQYEELITKVDQVGRMLNGLVRKIEG
ncbi:hypothetical protein BpOF4_06605 [Alkalihalophilus pseudofirmus OF4]|uniref:Four helix bundle protein n=1 Tax=Alkalihalophilus pseudofirmus (strain ATCC BAA-2126 / JCM 17055 / OF4) TaxID=398511 RepID=D3G0A4_ALKPO|nr:four helix bundle protein [Alkalihalophilus pseudofirmus]ADC49379.1 hypothetical protein BpOF4_06605 [Alkalihalophilus pseudofirmus OF4]